LQLLPKFTRFLYFSMRSNLTLRAAAIAFATVIATSFVPEASAQGVAAPTNTWIPATATRPSPQLQWLELMDKGSCPHSTCPRAHWISFLESLNLSELQAPNGGRAYRWFWFGTDPRGPLAMQAPHRGFVELLIDPGGKGILRSSWSRRAMDLDRKDTAPFETALAQTQFATLPSQTGQSCLDECEDQVMEAVIDGEYHFIARNGGIRETGVRDAGVMLEQLARKTAGQ